MTRDLSRRLTAIVDALPLRPGIRVLEIGCGSGATARAVANRIGDGHRDHNLRAGLNVTDPRLGNPRRGSVFHSRSTAYATIVGVARAASGGSKYGSSASRTFNLARWSSTRWLPSETFNS
jgi:hypothetical protein